ncbi:hypothetical protein JG687_00001041, partial [Phytophthora cactorum]
FPQKACTVTSCTADGTLRLKRSIGSEYRNTYLPVVNAVLKMNHDVNFLSAGEGIEKAYYMMKYTTKAQNEVENPLAIHMHVFNKAVSKRGDASDAILEGRRLVQSMCCTLSKPQEVSGPMTALFLLRESPFYSSCSFEKLFLGSIATVVFEGEAVDVMLHAAGSGATSQPSSPLLDYIQRPDELANTCLIDFVQQ